MFSCRDCHSFSPCSGLLVTRSGCIRRQMPTSQKLQMLRDSSKDSAITRCKTPRPGGLPVTKTYGTKVMGKIRHNKARRCEILLTRFGESAFALCTGLVSASSMRLPSVQVPSPASRILKSKAKSRSVFRRMGRSDFPVSLKPKWILICILSISSPARLGSRPNLRRCDP